MICQQPSLKIRKKDWTTERVRPDENGDSEGDEDDELPCVIGDEGERDCIWRGSRSSIEKVQRSEKSF